MFTAKERVLLDKNGNCVPDGDPAGVEVLAGFKGALVPEKTFRIKKVKGFKKFFAGTPAEEAEKEAAPQKRVVAESAPAHSKPAVIKGGK